MVGERNKSEASCMCCQQNMWAVSLSRVEGMPGSTVDNQCALQWCLNVFKYVHVFLSIFKVYKKMFKKNKVTFLPVSFLFMTYGKKGIRTMV